MFKESDIVIAKDDHPGKKVVAGQVGTVICCFTVPNEAYEVEFVDDDGKPVAQFALLPDEIEAYSL